MHSRNLPPMSGGSDDHAHSGHLHDGHHHEVICIEVNKVFDFCFQEEHIERTFNVPKDVPSDVVVECKILEDEIVCREVGERHRVDHKHDRELVCLAIEVPVRLTLVDKHNPNFVISVLRERVVFLKQAVLCAPRGTNVECEVTGNCCCFFDKHSKQISCVFDFCVLLKTVALVRVLVPTLGMCVPKHCESVRTGCPPQPIKDCDFRRCD